MYAFRFTPCSLHVPPILSSLIYLLNNICWRVKIMQLLIMQFPVAFCHFIPS
jgi:hypothetical protein